MMIRYTRRAIRRDGSSEATPWSTNSPRQLNVPRHDRYALGVNSAKVSEYRTSVNGSAQVD
jgi:hypothetical protein